MKKRYTKQSAGFTIIELLIATVVFSIVLVVVLAAFVQISRLYYKGISLSNTQDDTRIITQDIENDILYSNSSTTPNVNIDLQNPVPSSATPAGCTPGTYQCYFCVGQHVYEYKLFSQLSGASGSYALRRSDSATCTPSAANQNKEELLGPGMQLNGLYVSCQLGESCEIHVHVVFYGGPSNKLFYSPTNKTPAVNAPDAQCTGALADSQICAATDYKRTVLQTI